MGLIILLVVLVFLFGGLGSYGYYAGGRPVYYGSGGGLGIILLIILLVFLFRGGF